MYTFNEYLPKNCPECFLKYFPQEEEKPSGLNQENCEVYREEEKAAVRKQDFSIFINKFNNVIRFTGKNFTEFAKRVHRYGHVVFQIVQCSGIKTVVFDQTVCAQPSFSHCFP